MYMMHTQNHTHTHTLAHVHTVCPYRRTDTVHVHLKSCLCTQEPSRTPQELSVLSPVLWAPGAFTPCLQHQECAHDVCVRVCVKMHICCWAPVAFTPCLQHQECTHDVCVCVCVRARVCVCVCVCVYIHICYWAPGAFTPRHITKSKRMQCRIYSQKGCSVGFTKGCSVGCSEGCSVGFTL